MKVKLNFQRRYSVLITIIACASSILMLVKRFGYPEEELVQTIWVSLSLLVFLMVIAAGVAFLFRLLAGRSDDFSETDTKEDPE